VRLWTQVAQVLICDAQWFSAQLCIESANEGFAHAHMYDLRKEVGARTLLTPLHDGTQDGATCMPSIIGMELVYTADSGINEFIANHYLAMRTEKAGSRNDSFASDDNSLKLPVQLVEDQQTQLQVQLLHGNSTQQAQARTSCQQPVVNVAWQTSPIEVCLKRGDIKLANSVQMCDQASLARKIKHLLHAYDTFKFAQYVQ